jgi:hypothetical protein
MMGRTETDRNKANHGARSQVVGAPSQELTGFFIYPFRLAHPPFLRKLSMTKRSPFRVYFSCLSCGALYSAEQRRSMGILVSRFTCIRCKATVHSWRGGRYSFTDWQGPLD